MSNAPSSNHTSKLAEQELDSQDYFAILQSPDVCTSWQDVSYTGDGMHAYLPESSSNMYSYADLHSPDLPVDTGLGDIWQWFDEPHESLDQIGIKPLNENASNSLFTGTEVIHVPSDLEIDKTKYLSSCLSCPHPRTRQPDIPDIILHGGESSSRLAENADYHLSPLRESCDILPKDDPVIHRHPKAVPRRRKRVQASEAELEQQYEEFWKVFKAQGLDADLSPEALAEAVYHLDTSFTCPRTVTTLMKEYLTNKKSAFYMERYLTCWKQIKDSIRNVRFYYKRMSKDPNWTIDIGYFAKQLVQRHRVNLNQSLEKIAEETKELRTNLLLGKKYTRAIEKFLFDTRGPFEAAKWRRLHSCETHG